MLERTKFDEKINLLKDISTHYDNESIRSAVELVSKSRDEFELKILMVGHFNAGKSSLINSFIGKPGFLKVELGETTAIASELRYSENEKSYSYDKNLNRESLIPGKEYLPTEYDHISYFINSEGLKAIEDFVLVDTPGFDTSQIEHTRALASYLGYGVGFFVVIDVQRGAIDSETLRYLYEISKYSQNIAVLVNKCDKRIDSDIKEVVEGIKHSLYMSGFDYPVYEISKYDKMVIPKIAEIVSKIDAQKEYDIAINNIVVSNAKAIRSILRAVAEEQFLDTYEYDEVIRIQERRKELARKSFENKKRELVETIDEDVEVVIGKLKSALRTKSDEAARAIELKSIGGLQAIILDAVRPVLVDSLKEFSVEKVSEISKSFELSDNCTLDEKEKGLGEIATDIASKVQGLIQSGAFLGDKDDENQDKDADSKKKKGSGGDAAYKLITAALSIVTGGTVTWVEALIVLLPEILAGLKCLFGESNHSKIIKQYEETIIPQVTNSLWPTIKESYEKSIETMIMIFEEETEKSLNSITKLIEEAKNSKLKCSEDYENFKSMLENDIKSIERIMVNDNE